MTFRQAFSLFKRRYLAAIDRSVSRAAADSEELKLWTSKPRSIMVACWQEAILSLPPEGIFRFLKDDAIAVQAPPDRMGRTWRITTPEEHKKYKKGLRAECYGRGWTPEEAWQDACETSWTMICNGPAEIFDEAIRRIGQEVRP